MIVAARIQSKHWQPSTLKHESRAALPKVRVAMPTVALERPLLLNNCRKRAPMQFLLRVVVDFVAGADNILIVYYPRKSYIGHSGYCQP